MKNIEKNECLTNFGKFVRTGREKRDITQADAAELLGVTQQHLSNVELGKRSIDFTDALEICKALKLDLRDFIETYM